MCLPPSSLAPRTSAEYEREALERGLIEPLLQVDDFALAELDAHEDAPPALHGGADGCFRVVDAVVQGHASEHRAVERDRDRRRMEAAPCRAASLLAHRPLAA